MGKSQAQCPRGRPLTPRARDAAPEGSFQVALERNWPEPWPSQKGSVLPRSPEGLWPRAIQTRPAIEPFPTWALASVPRGPPANLLSIQTSFCSWKTPAETIRPPARPHPLRKVRDHLLCPIHVSLPSPGFLDQHEGKVENVQGSPAHEPPCPAGAA